MIWTIISAIIVGAIIGALARLVMPGRQNIGIIMTVILGIVGGLIGSWITQAVGYQNHSGFAWIPFIVGVIVAAVLIAIYMSITGKRRDRV
ncbi:MAG TPA: GlsB/YeaQ/YmgE family stress response membrane protein [Segeticoccus sp.]|uniref:GlsB/YeaQ/YmgE family stress response membrane protein n=1 Tax=Segeticoccus sp. TaxID=2706531 RepID=UPI002D80DFE8|nr:GlsB/YeaQ/YmgE family stress response membrane protein [Segeticoccus sp.]HET8599926.1 GlsB/YeaQ/YmgE family stress response membrane protein [Segeticoccus sp.]